MPVARLAALVVTVAVLAVGVSYVMNRPTTWGSEAQVVLVPEPATRTAGNPLDSFTAGGTLGTTVEMLSSPDLANQISVTGVSFKVRAIADSRVIRLEATGPKDAVRTGLADLVRVAIPAQQRLADRWHLAPLTQPTMAAPVGPSTTTLLMVCMLLSGLAAAAVLTAAHRLLPELSNRRLRRPRRRTSTRSQRAPWRTEQEQ